MPDVRNLLSQKPSEVKAPPPVPKGTYRWLIQKHEFGESSQKKTPYVRLHLKALEPQADVDMAAVTELGGLDKIELQHDFWISQDALYRLTEFTTQHLSLPDTTVDEQLAVMDGKTFLGVVDHEQFQRKDGSEGVRARITQTGADQ